MRIIPYSHQSIRSDDIKEVVKALKSDWITQGPKIREFEEALSKYTGAKYAIAVSSGTAALHLSMLALDVGKQDKLLTSPITFSASANCALYVGAKPEFIDIDDRAYHLDINRLESFLKVPSNRHGIKVVVPVHFMGTVIDIIKIKEICDKYGIKIVEDAAHALGAKYKFRNKWVKVGSCKHSDITIFSFHPIKHITTGEGGAILTNSKRIYESLLRLRHHGIIKGLRPTSPLLRKFSENYWFYDIPHFGFNYRITDFQCSLGISQLKKLDSLVQVRRNLVQVYNRSLSEIDQIKVPYERDGTYASYHLYVIRVPANKRNDLYNYLRENHIYTQVSYIPIHLLTYYQENFGYKDGDFPIAEKYFRECLSLPLYPDLSKTDHCRIISKVKRFFQK